MNYLKGILIAAVLMISMGVHAQTTSLIGKSEDFILENVKGYENVEKRGLEHEEFDILVFENKDTELSFFFTFYKGDKVCNYIKNKGPFAALQPEVDQIKTHFIKIAENVWEKPDKSVQVQISTAIDGQAVILVREVRQ